MRSDDYYLVHDDAHAEGAGTPPFPPPGNSGSPPPGVKTVC